MAATLVLSAGAAFAQDSTQADPREENRRERLSLGIKPDLRRVSDVLVDRAEAARVRHHEGEPQLGLTARLDRVDATESAAVTRARHEGAVKDARIARVLGKRNDRREREENTALELAFRLKKLNLGQFDRSLVGIAKTREDERYGDQHQKREEGKQDSRLDTKSERPERDWEKGFERDENLRQLREERAAAKAEKEAEKKDDKKAEKDADKADKKADAAAEKKADKAEALKDRADDRKDVRSDAKIESASDRKTP